MTAPTRSSPCPDRLGCSWTAHGRKHFPHRGLTREHTLHGPAKYVPGTSPELIRQLETGTVRAPDAVLAPPPGKAEYVRKLGAVIGWERGMDATRSFVECSGGQTAGRAYHGRPMAGGNPRLEASVDGRD